MRGRFNSKTTKTFELGISIKYINGTRYNPLDQMVFFLMFSWLVAFWSAAFDQRVAFLVEVNSPVLHNRNCGPPALVDDEMNGSKT